MSQRLDSQLVKSKMFSFNFAANNDDVDSHYENGGGRTPSEEREFLTTLKEDISNLALEASSTKIMLDNLATEGAYLEE